MINMLTSYLLNEYLPTNSAFFLSNSLARLKASWQESDINFALLNFTELLEMFSDKTSYWSNSQLNYLISTKEGIPYLVNLWVRFIIATSIVKHELKVWHEVIQSGILISIKLGVDLSHVYGLFYQCIIIWIFLLESKQNWWHQLLF